MKKCEHCGITEDETRIISSKKLGIVLCRRHYLQLIKHGEINRTPMDKNEIMKHEEHIEIKLYDRDGNHIATTITDIEFYDLVKDTKWYHKDGYARGSVKEQSKKVFLHRIIANPKDGLKVDHIDGDGLNNMKINLRCCTHKQNLRNMHKDSIIGVNWNKHNGKYKWIPKIMVDGKGIWLGVYDNKEEAIVKRLEAENKYFGEYAPQKHLLEEYGINSQ